MLSLISTCLTRKIFSTVTFLVIVLITNQVVLAQTSVFGKSQPQGEPMPNWALSFTQIGNLSQPSKPYTVQFVTSNNLNPVTIAEEEFYPQPIQLISTVNQRHVLAYVDNSKKIANVFTDESGSWQSTNLSINSGLIGSIALARDPQMSGRFYLLMTSGPNLTSQNILSVYSHENGVWSAPQVIPNTGFIFPTARIFVVADGTILAFYTKNVNNFPFGIDEKVFLASKSQTTNSWTTKEIATIPDVFSTANQKIVLHRAIEDGDGIPRVFGSIAAPDNNHSSPFILSWNKLTNAWELAIPSIASLSSNSLAIGQNGASLLVALIAGGISKVYSTTGSNADELFSYYLTGTASAPQADIIAQNDDILLATGNDGGLAVVAASTKALQATQYRNGSAPVKPLNTSVIWQYSGSAYVSNLILDE